MGEGATSVDNLPVKGRASEAEEQKTDTEEGPEPKQPEDGDEGRRQDGADGRRRYGPDDESDCGSPKRTTNSFGMTDECARSSGRQTMLKNALVTNQETDKKQEKTEPEQQSRMNAPPPEAGTLP
ncbi:hypothetical protein GN958_ATG13724 [Phytophthora infestans]|uniref:Uncharacterized protein n=1 Tax=Phytophthora infestans TaxID=4787 RepID=A0A8S9UFD2_PHYIN|nr:hypothetical protein GN958_ATG13724 [Phytophthora infestans]